MKKMILSCLVVVTLALLSGCATHSSKTSSEKTTMPDLNTNTTGDIQAK